MSKNDNISNSLLKLNKCIELGRKEVELYPASSLLVNIFDLLKEKGFIGSYDLEETSRGNKITVNLIGKINKIKSIKPRFPVSLNGDNDYESFERRYLLAKDFGLLLVSTSKGLMSHIDAKDKNLGGRLIAYCY